MSRQPDTSLHARAGAGAHFVGSVANLIVVEAARSERVTITMRDYCRVGVPLTLVTLILGWMILSLVPI